jgi:hypothetical protein
MASGPLSTDQIDEFIERGWTLLRHAFPSTVAQAVRKNLSGRIGVDLERPEQWSEPKVWLQTVMKEAPYTDALTERFHSAVDQLVGAGRWNMTQAMGWWPITFPGFDDPPYGDDWHIDGGWLPHHIHSPEQALLNLFCFRRWSLVGARRRRSGRRGGRCGSGAPTAVPLVQSQSRDLPPSHGSACLQHDRAHVHRRRRSLSGRDPLGPGKAVNLRGGQSAIEV